MDQPDIQRYGPGDVVEITVSFLHGMRIKNVIATFFDQQNPVFTLTMSGAPELYEEQAYRDQADWEQPNVLRSYANLAHEIPAEAPPGVYSLQLLELFTYSDKSYSYKGENLGAHIAAFEVMPESEDPPVIQGSAIS